MVSVVLPVHPGLAGLVTSMVGFDLRLHRDASHFGEPGTSATLLIALDDPFDVGWAGESSSGYSTLVAGLHTRPSIVRTHGRQYGLQLALTPLGVRALLSVPMSEITCQLVTLDHVSGAFLSGLQERLRVEDWDDRLRLVEEVLLRRAADASTDPWPEVVEAWRILWATGGQVRVDDVARHVGWSRRYLTTRFTEEMGLGPKQAARLHRYTRSRRLVERGAPPVDVAARCGFSDQAHLSREWKQLGGQSPSTWQEFPILQDGTPAATAD